MSEVVMMKGTKQAPKAVRSKMDTLMLTPSIIEAWIAPPFQRPLKMNERVRAIAEELKHNGGVIDGVLTLGSVQGDTALYLLDGQHRVAAFRLSDLQECIADVRICAFANLGEMGDEFVKLNSSIVRMTPDDVLRGMEGTIPAIHNIKDACKFVAYNNVRRANGGPVLSMSSAIRGWFGSNGETPKQITTSAVVLAREMLAADAQELIKFLNLARSAWGEDPQNYRLWTALNLCLCMWLYRKLVIDKNTRGTRRYVVVNPDIFKKCLMSVAANTDYVDWLVGRGLSERNRAPCYLRLKSIFVSRLKLEYHNEKPTMPQPAWTGTTTRLWSGGHVTE